VIDRYAEMVVNLAGTKLPGLGPVQFPQNLYTRHTVAAKVGHTEANGTQPILATIPPWG
jgi:hypothetical protein